MPPKQHRASDRFELPETDPTAARFMRVVPIINREDDSHAIMDSNKIKRKAQEADEPEAKRVKPSSLEAIAPVNESSFATTNDHNADDGQEHVAGKGAKADIATQSTNDDVTSDDVAFHAHHQAETMPAHSIFGRDAHHATSVSASRKRHADGDDDTYRGKRVKTAEDAAAANIDFASLVPAPGSLVPPELRANKDTFPFMFLPVEIRLKIYAHLFKRHKPVCPLVEGHSAANWDKPGFRKGLVLAIVTANKKLSKEVTHFIYSNNCFRLSLRYHRDWIRIIGHKNSSLIQDIILVGSGRAKSAPQLLSAMLDTLWKRASGSLRRITVHDEWANLDGNFIPRQLIAFGEKKTWNKFSRLESITLDVPYKTAPVYNKSLYEKLCIETEANITGRYHVLGWHQPLQQGRHGLRVAGTVWLEMRAEEFKEKMALQKQERHKALLEKKAKARREAQFAKRQQMKGEQAEQDGGQDGDQNGDQNGAGDSA